jgi:hypothetical protein
MEDIKLEGRVFMNSTDGIEELYRRMKKAQLPFEAQEYSNGVVIAVPSFEAGRIVSAVQVGGQQSAKHVRLCKVGTLNESIDCTPDAAVMLIKTYIDEAERRRRVYR